MPPAITADVAEIVTGKLDGTTGVRVTFPDGDCVFLDYATSYSLMYELQFALCEIWHRDGKIPDSDIIRDLIRGNAELMHPRDEGAQLRALHEMESDEEELDEQDD